MAQEDHAEFRTRFVQAHPDVILLDAKEPHKKFVEKLSRDFLVQGMVPFYPVAEIRTRADSIIQKSGLTKNAEDLLSITKADEPDQVTDSSTLINRIHALFMGLEYLNICAYSRAAGPLKYLQELEQFGLPYLMAADTLLRKKVNRLQAEQRELYPTFEQALTEVLRNHKYLWNDARTRAVLVKVDKKRDELPPESDAVEDDPSSITTPRPKKKRRRDRGRGTLKKTDKAEEKPGKITAGSKLDKDKRIPESEWKLITEAAGKVTGAKRCHYFNSSMGCAMGDKCRFKHHCMICGAAHPMVGNP